jgi:hypothetical protein
LSEGEPVGSALFDVVLAFVGKLGGYDDGYDDGVSLTITSLTGDGTENVIGADTATDGTDEGV